MPLSPEFIGYLADRLAADLTTAGPRFSAAAAEADLAARRSLQDAAAAIGLPVIEFEPRAVSISVDGCVAMLIVFAWDADINGKLEGALSQMQDLVAEETTEQWPPCPKHRRHPLEPVAQNAIVHWSCPEPGGPTVPLGSLAQAWRSSG
jgi:hypothetical protein